jgi:hypothetical protein
MLAVTHTDLFNEACESGDLVTAKHIFKNFLDKDDIKYSLHRAHDVSVAKFLVENGATDFYYAIMLAARRGHLEIIKYLCSVDPGENVGIYTSNAAAALCEACKANRPDIVKYVLSLNPNLDMSFEFNVASTNGFTEIVSELLKVYIKCPATQRRPRSLTWALRDAAINGHMNLVRLYIESNPNTDVYLTQSSLYTVAYEMCKAKNLNHVTYFDIFRYLGDNMTSPRPTNSITHALCNGYYDMANYILVQMRSWPFPVKKVNEDNEEDSEANDDSEKNEEINNKLLVLEEPYKAYFEYLFNRMIEKRKLRFLLGQDLFMKTNNFL